MLAFTTSLPLSNCRAGSNTLGNTSNVSTVRNNALQMVMSNRESKSQKQIKSNMLKRPPVRRLEINEPVPIKNVQPIVQPEAPAQEEKVDIPLRITGNNIPMTDSIRGYVEEKLGKVMVRYDTLLTKVDVHLTVEHNPSIPNKNKAEVVAFVGKTILRSEVKSDDMYSAIDLVQQRIVRVIRKFKERRDSKHHNKTSISQTSSSQLTMDTPPDNSFMMEDDDLMAKYKDLYEDSIRKEIIPGIPPVTEVVKRKVLPMPLQSVEEAVLCCEYVDHPWYLFRNAETKEICLVYKRNHGGYGLIEPSNPNSKDEEQVM